jgi:hypothetical protein
VYLLSANEHLLQAAWQQKHSARRLGVGSLLTALDKRFGRGRFYQSETEGLSYPGFDVDFDGRCYDTLKRNAAIRGPTCLVTGMWLFLSPEVVK